MFTKKQFPDSISGDELDHYLEQGWYRMGLGIFTCHFLFFEDNLFSSIWLRLPLNDFQLRKSLQKILRVNRGRFRTVIKKAQIDAEKEALFQQYKSRFKGRLSENLKDSLHDGQDSSIFDTFEVAIYDGERLVAFSFFDLGRKSLASIKGVYEPAYAQFSLGIYTMLEEIQFGVELGFDYYYPGYIVPGYDRFDYKLRIGKSEALQFFDLKSHSWKPMSHFGNHNIPVIVLSEKLNHVGQVLSMIGLASQLLFYPAYEANFYYFENERFLESPLFLTLYCNVFPRPRFIVYYDLWKDVYVFTHCMPVEDLGLYFEYTMQFDTQEAKHFLDFILKKTLIIETNDLKKLIRPITEIGRLIKSPGRLRVLK